MFRKINDDDDENSFLFKGCCGYIKNMMKWCPYTKCETKGCKAAVAVGAVAIVIGSIGWYMWKNKKCPFARCGSNANDTKDTNDAKVDEVSVIETTSATVLP